MSSQSDSVNFETQQRQFLLYDRHVLRFECYWDDEEGQEVRDMVLHYYLADDTLEIREVIRPNTGRDAVPVFVKRAKLPKNGQSVFPPGAITPRNGAWVQEIRFDLRQDQAP